jgi:hypothetical protein
MWWIIAVLVALALFVLYCLFRFSGQQAEAEERIAETMLRKLERACLDEAPEADETHSATRYAHRFDAEEAPLPSPPLSEETIEGRR